MAPLLFALLLLAQDGAVQPASTDGPMATAQPRKQDVAPLPIQGGPVSPPTDDYGYVAWCLGAVGGYAELYDRAMPDVIRIERAWPTPSTEDNIKHVYPSQKKEAEANVALFKRAIEAAEKASASPISNQGAAAMRKGRALWTGATTVPKAQLAQFWMSWTPPAKCEATAKALEQRSNLFGQALTYNAKPEAAPTDATPAEAAPAPAPAAVAAAPQDEPAPEAKKPDAAPPEPTVETAEPAREQPAPEPSAGSEETVPASAIDGLVDSAQGEPPAATAAAVSEEAAPEKAAEPEEKPAEVTPASTKKTPKPGLKDTLIALRGRQ